MTTTVALHTSPTLHFPRSLPRSSTILLTILLMGIFFIAILLLATFYLCRAATFLNWRAHQIAEAKADREAKNRAKEEKAQKIKDAENAARERAEIMVKELENGCYCDCEVERCSCEGK
ncbi:hypothetical protein BGX38DRAFT_1267221 [Terfezia claveryi]|nr:hypothetical protein BGX38DRAFT_1267221 [Terfezia claveryi]